MLLRLLPLVAAQSSAVSALNSAWPAGMPWNYQIRYTTVANKRCNMDSFSNYLEVYSDDTIITNLGATVDIKSKLCSAGDAGYCAPGSTAAWCQGEDGTLGANYAFCDSEAVCKQACDASAECYGVETAVGSNRCYLLRRECQTKLLEGTLANESPTVYKYQAKMDKQELSGAELCPLGVAVQGFGMTDPSGGCDLNGQYDPIEGDDSKYLGPAGCSSLQWSDKGCGWEIMVSAPQTDEEDFFEAATGCWSMADTCVNNEIAANYIFGYAEDSDGYMPDICEVTTFWLDAHPTDATLDGYCSNAAWRALCPQSCIMHTDFVAPACPCAEWADMDNTAAAEYVATMLGQVATDDSTDPPTSLACTNLKSLCVDDPVIQHICVATCASVRRLGTEAAASPLSTKMRAMMREQLAQGFRKDIGSLHRQRTQEHQRRLQGARKLNAHGRMLYSTWDITDKTGLACAQYDAEQAAQKRAETGLIATPELFDIHALTVPVEGFSVEVYCPDQPAYTTESNTFCTTNNLAIGEFPEDYPEAAPFLCWNACLAASAHGAGVDGPPDYCSGADPAYNQYSNALCAPREKCEELCSELDDCVGFEMHTVYPRCYLNRAECGHDAIADPQYDSVIKGMAAHAYKSHTSRSCATASSYSPPLLSAMDRCGSKCAHAPDGTCTGLTGDAATTYADWACLKRERCEEICSADDNCAGFEVTKGYDPVAGAWVAPQACSFRPLNDPPRTGLCTLDSLFDGVTITPGSKVALDYVAWTAHAAANNQPGGGEYVEKKLSVGKGTARYITPCKARVAGNPVGESGDWEPMEVGVDAECAGLSYTGQCYTSGDGEMRLAWSGDASFDEQPNGLDRRTGGWVVQHVEHGGPWHSLFSYNMYNDVATATSSDLAGAAALYEWTPPVDENAGLEYTCLSYESCGTLSTCVLPQGRFEAELKQQYRNQDSTHPLATQSPEILSEIFDSTTYKPKTIISVERAVAFVGAEKWEWAEDIYRNVPGHLRIQLNSIGSANKAVITMVSADAQASLNQLDVAYSPPMGYEPWYTDLVRVERFTTDGSPLGDDAMVIDVYAPIDGDLKVFNAATGAAVPCARNTYKASGWWSVTVTQDGDYIGTTALRCSATPTAVGIADSAECKDYAPGDTCTPKCASGYVSAGELTCVEGMWTGVACDQQVMYHAEDVFFRLQHRSRMDYGWRIQGIAAFTDDDCTMHAHVHVDYDASSESQNGFSSFENAWNDGRADQSMGEWWSKALNVNPYSVDQTHGGGVHVDFAAQGDIRCVKVQQRSMTGHLGHEEDRQYFPTEQVLARGWRSNDRQPMGEFDARETSLHGWTQVWTADAEHEGDIAMTTFRPTCGIDAVIYGELIEAVDGVDSACHCRQLCIDTDMCRSWKWRPGLCHLQSNIVSVESQSTNCATYNWVSGDTGIRFNTGGRKRDRVANTAAEVAVERVGAWSDFDLVLHGVNFPTAEAAELHSTTAPRQRIKLVPHGASCAESAIATGVDGIGCSHPYFCTPRPSSTDDSTLRWTGLSIQKQEEAKTYDVCYSSGDTASRWSWHYVDSLTVPGAAFTWSTTPATVSRTTETFSLHVHGDMLLTPGTSLRAKLLRPGVDDCALGSEAKFNVSKSWATSDGSFMANVFPDDMASVEFTGLVNPTEFNQATESFTGVGIYTVCLSVDDGATYRQIPSADALKLEISGEEGDSSHPRKVFHSQMLSGRNGSVVLTLKGHRLRLPSRSAVRISEDASCSAMTASYVSEAESDADGFVFNVDLTGVDPGSKSICYCDDQVDSSAETDSTNLTYHVKANSQCTTAPEAEAAEAWAAGGIAKAAINSDYVEHFCQAKCSRGCVGANCYCDGYDPRTMSVAAGDDGMGPLCIDATGCRDACSVTANCTGFDFNPEKNFCWLYGSNNTCANTFVEGKESWAKVNGSTCQDTDDFVVVGTLELTGRPYVGHDWVIQPHAKASLEVLGNDLDFHTDRIMVIDSTGTCGITGPSASVERVDDERCDDNEDYRTHYYYACSDWDGDCGDDHLIEDCSWYEGIVSADGSQCQVGGQHIFDEEWGAHFFYSKAFINELRANCGSSCHSKMCDDVGQWNFNHWVAKNNFIDDPVGERESEEAAEALDLTWVEKTGKYCSGNNMPPAAMGESAKHTCFTKCVKDAPCVGDDCFCDGLYAGFDKPDSAALCLDLAGCKAACTANDDCFGFDMNNDVPRCFLNFQYDTPGGCPEQVQLGQLATIDTYSFWFKHPHQNDRRKLERRDDRRLLAVVDTGYSWPQMLRFDGISFSTGGTFTACFCDSKVNRANGHSVELCSKPEDYKVSVGTVHVSGVECLLQQSKFQRGTCVSHFHSGGLRCYPGEEPAYQYPSPVEMAATIFPDAAADAAAGHLSSYCLYGPEEETRDDPLCQWPA